MTALEPARSPCQPHPCSVEHADVVRGYREFAALWELAAEQATSGYAAELAHYLEEHPRPSFKDYLMGKVR